MLLSTLQPDPIPRVTDGNGIKQILVSKWLGQELDCARFHSPDRHRDIAVSRDKDDRKRPLRARKKLSLHVQAALPWHSDIKNHASGAIRQIGLEEFLSRAKWDKTKSDGAKESIQATSHIRTVVDNDHIQFAWPVHHRFVSPYSPTMKRSAI